MITNAKWYREVFHNELWDNYSKKFYKRQKTEKVDGAELIGSLLSMLGMLFIILVASGRIH